MGTTAELEKLRAGIAEAPRDQQGHRQYDEALKEAVREYARRRLRAGRTAESTIARELGMSADTLWSWMHREEASGTRARERKALPERAREFRAAVAALGARTRTTPYPPELRRLGLAYLKARQVAGASWRDVASELGIGSDTLRKWSGHRRTRSSSVRRVSITSTASTSTITPTRSLVVHGPAGLRIEGMDVAAVAALLKELS